MGWPATVVSPSLLSCDFAHIADKVRRVEDAGADWLHVDVMDGHFVPNLTLGPPVVAAIRRVAKKPLDVHLMISEPVRYARDFAQAGAHGLTFHWEVAPDAAKAREVVRVFRGEGIAVAGVSVRPHTPIEVLAPILGDVDLVLVMSVEPGFGGQEFMPESLAKTRWLRAQGFAGHVEMDGGLNERTQPLCAEAGANAFVAGSAIFKSRDMRATIAAFRSNADAARQRPVGA